MANVILNCNIEILESDAEINKKILLAIFEQLNKKIRRAVDPIERRIKEAIRLELYSTPEYLSLTSDNGFLRLQLGIADASVLVPQIIEEYLDGIYVNISALGILQGWTIDIKGVNPDYNKLESMGEYISINAAENQTLIPWLRWLLREGDITIRGYQLRTDFDIPQRVLNRYSRTKRGLMMKKFAARWTIQPPEYRGTENNNFITRSIERATKKIKNGVLSEIKIRLR